MKALNEAYHVLRNADRRRAYDAQRKQPAPAVRQTVAAPAAREVGSFGQALSALLCIALGSLLLLLVRFNGLWFLWPMSVLAGGVVLFGVMMAHAAMTSTREAWRPAPAKSLRVLQELVFWVIVAGGGFALYLILTTI